MASFIVNGQSLNSSFWQDIHQEMASQVVIKPTFLLKGIEPFDLSEEYKSGQILVTLAFEKKKIAPVALTTNRGKSFRDGIYTFRNRDNFVHTIATTGAKSFSFVNEKGEPQQGGICVACHEEFNHEALGIPIHLVQHNEKVLVFRIYVTCNFHCTLRLIRLLQRIRHRPVNLTHAEQFLRYLYSKMHPEGPPLQEAADPLLLESHDGSLNPEEYKDQRYTYVSVSNLIFYPAKEQYLRFQT